MNETEQDSTATRKDSSAASQGSPWRVIGWAAWTALGFVAGTVLVSRAVPRPPCGLKITCDVNLKGIGKAVALYREDNQGAAPLEFRALVDEGYASSKMFVCTKVRARGAAAPARPADIETHCDYIYVPVPPAAVGADQGLLCTYELPLNHNQHGLNVLRWNGQVSWEAPPGTEFVQEVQGVNDALAGGGTIDP